MRAPRLLLAAACLAGSSSRALEIVFTDVGPENGVSALSAQALAGFQAAASLWESLLIDPVTVRINVATYDFGPANANIIGFADSASYFGDYTELRGAMVADATSLTDAAVLARLPVGPGFVRRINLTTDLANPATPVLSASTQFSVNGGNARALGMLPGDWPEADALIAFNSAFAFDYDRANGIAANQMDFIGVAAHEIGHALGFISVVDAIDGGGMTTASALSTPLDFLRHSQASLALGVHDVSIDNQIRFLAIGNLGILMSTGVSNGDGGQGSHFVDNAGLGMMDPTASFGELRTFTGYDLMVFDAIGWDLSPEALSLAAAAMSQIPEPSTYGLALAGLALGWAATRRRRPR
ncbi:MAG: NF038122 family metalloprotease [Opitutia bacterium]